MDEITASKMAKWRFSGVRGYWKQDLWGICPTTTWHQLYAGFSAEFKAYLEKRQQELDAQAHVEANEASPKGKL